MICYECEAERIEHDEAEKRTERDHEKQRGHFETATGKTPQVKDQSGAGRRKNEPEIENRVRRIDAPLRINEGEVGRPKYFTEIKPDRATCDQQSFDRPERNKGSCYL